MKKIIIIFIAVILLSGCSELMEQIETAKTTGREYGNCGIN